MAPIEARDVCVDAFESCCSRAEMLARRDMLPVSPPHPLVLRFPGGRQVPLTASGVVIGRHDFPQLGAFLSRYLVLIVSTVQT